MWCAGADAPKWVERSVVHITTFIQMPVWDAPWRFDQVRKATGSGFVIAGRRIMTNAHVVSWAKEILVKRYQDSRPVAAKVRFIAHDCDLAILETDDPAFFEGVAPLKFGTLPKVRSTVVTHGYPAGGEQISYTRGVVSRIDMQNYSHIGNRSYLTVQTDAAINPGNSGGPVIQDDLVVGVAFQGIRGLENTGFFIPPPVIEHFLKDIADGTYDGFPDCGLALVPLENPAYRRFLKLPENVGGARVDQMLPIPGTAKVMQVDDVILQVAGVDVAGDATILYQGNRVNAGVAFDAVQAGENLPLKIWRQGRMADVSVPMAVYREDRAEGNQYDVLPRYFVKGGLVFVPLSLDYLKTLGRDWAKESSPELLYELGFASVEKPDKKRKEPVVLATVLAHPVNADLQHRRCTLVDKVNGVRIDCLEDVVKAFESGKTPFHVVEFTLKGEFECLDRTEVERVDAEILKTYGIQKDRRL